ncbi:hypothetical protein J1N09_12120 [Aureitalea sp. L0-47]|uniref:hypothetical protein n=1 Tax=Aureitalea sp. L0-47 TaxID=2816962 RepID=UPI0022390624|nr:hypothetical protein [Aureitalea sp. L0-47]MCW5520592.1 hypothetical protein [Aureitalea sp. L0-47]
MSQADKKITLATAKSWTANWRNAPSTSAKAFLIPIQDLQGAISEIQNQGGNPMARAYLGIDPSDNTEKLIIVGTNQETDKAGNTVYRDLLPADENTTDGGNSIWDFTRPCPPYCDDNSALS